MSEYVRWFADLRKEDVGIAGGKNASLGEMISTLTAEGISVPDGFATTADAFWRYVDDNGIRDAIARDVAAWESGTMTLQDAGSSIRRTIRHGEFPDDIAEQIVAAYRELGTRYDAEFPDVAVRSSATAEDLPDASFAGQQETFLNVTGEGALLDACRDCYASLFTDRAISYRHEQGFDQLSVALSVGVQKMVRSDVGGSGVMFTIDTENGLPTLVVIDAAWGLGEMVVQGAVTPDEYRVFKPALADEDKDPIIERRLGDKARKMIYAGGAKATKIVDTSKSERARFVLAADEVLQLARWATRIEEHYGRPMDLEWAKDGITGDLSIVQARPETVQSRQTGALKTYRLLERTEPILEGLSVGGAISSAPAIVIESADDLDRFEDGSILVTGMTDPDWVPVMKRAAGIITDHGGRTSHAAIVSRELAVPAIVGTGDATHTLTDGQVITLSCAEGEIGYVYEGELPYETEEVSLDDVPATETRVMMNIASPAAAFQWWRLPAAGIGLARMEFIINDVIKVHPMALVHFDRVEDARDRREIERLTNGYDDKTEYFVDNLASGVAQIAVTQYPDPVILRMSDFKTNEYAGLIGGSAFETDEANPMLGFRGASRYYSPRYREGFALECAAVKRVRETMGLDNVIVMIPFCRTVEEADKVLGVMADNGLARGENGLQVYVMAEIPSNIELADQFSERFDGFSIGSNDLTQLTLGVDRDEGSLAELFSESNEAVKRSIARLIETAHQYGRKVGICGQGPSDDPAFAAYLVGLGIDSISLNPDSVIETTRVVAKAEAERP